MIFDRYPAPLADELFDPNYRLAMMRTCTDQYLLLAADRNTDEEEHDRIETELAGLHTPTWLQVRELEARNGHEVVAFLDLYTDQMKPETARWAHLGLTSSDLTEYALFSQLWSHGRQMAELLQDLAATLRRKGREVWAPRAGRTHGRIAQVTTLRHQFEVLAETCDRIVSDLDMMLIEGMPVKSPGPTGQASVALAWWDPAVIGDQNSHGTLGTQVLPRDLVLRWATYYLRAVCLAENLATLIRLGSRAEVDEIWEGGPARVGSSSMPGKRNPITSEKVCGLARTARGLFAAIAEGTVLWEDRDLTNSAAERVTVPQLAALTEHCVYAMLGVVEDLQHNPGRMIDGARHPAAAAGFLQAEFQSVVGLGPVPVGWALTRAMEEIGEPAQVNALWLTDVVTCAMAWLRVAPGQKAVREVVTRTLACLIAYGIEFKEYNK